MIFQCSIDIHRSRPKPSEFGTWPGVVSRFNLSAFNHYRTGLMTRPQSVETPLDLSNIQRFPMGFWHVQGQMWTRHWQTQCSTDVQRLRGGVCVPSSLESFTSQEFQQKWFVISAKSFDLQGMSSWLWLVSILAYSDFVFAKKKHLEVFKFDFEKNEMPNVSSIESSVDARSTLWESTRWCLLKVIPAFWCLKV